MVDREGVDLATYDITSEPRKPQRCLLTILPSNPKLHLSYVNLDPRATISWRLLA